MEKKISFSECTLLMLEDRFGLRLVLELPALNAWLQRSQEMTVTERDQIKLEDLQELLYINANNWNANNWNEQELSLHFIGPIFSIVKFSEMHRYNLFAERYIEATVQDYLLGGEPDEMIASGYFEPKIPYFVFAEYKRQRDPNGDPAGQALAAMLVGQTLNPQQHPLYGAYVVGRDWYFMALNNHQYAISRGHNALEADELNDILRILKALKAIVIELTV